MLSRNHLALFRTILIAIALTEVFKIRSAVQGEEIEGFTNDNWENERDLDFRAVVCSECPRRLKPPTQCNICIVDADCDLDKVCCPFLTLSTTQRVCSAEQNKNCRLTNTIRIDLLHSACSCVRQVKCCVKTTATTITHSVTVDSNSTETTTSEATKRWISNNGKVSPTESTVTTSEAATATGAA